MGFAAGMVAGTNLAKTVRKNMRDSAEDKRSQTTRDCSAAIATGDQAAIDACKGGIPEGKKEKKDAPSYELSSTDWASMGDDGESYIVYDDIAKMKGQATSGTFGETGMPPPEQLQGVGAAEGGAIEQVLPDPIQQGVGGEPIPPTVNMPERNSAPPMAPEETVAADVPRTSAADAIVRQQAVQQERNNTPMTARQMRSLEANMLRSMDITTPAELQEAIGGVRARRQQQAVGYITASKSAYAAGDMEEATRSARMAFSFLPSGSSLQFASVEGKVAGVTIDDHSGKRKSSPFVLGDDFYKSAEAIMKDPAQWNLWTAKGEREEKEHDARVGLARAQTLNQLGSAVLSMFPAAKGKGTGVGGGWKSPEQFQKQALAVDESMGSLSKNTTFSQHSRVMDSFTNFYAEDKPHNMQQARFVAHGLTEANPTAQPAQTVNMAGTIAWHGAATEEMRAASGVGVSLVKDSSAPYGYKVAVTRTVKDADGNDMNLRPEVMNATPEMIAAAGEPMGNEAGKAAAARVAAMEWAIEWATGEKETIFGPPNDDQINAVANGKATVVDKGGIEDPNAISTVVADAVQAAKKAPVSTDKQEVQGPRTAKEAAADSMVIPAEDGMPAINFDVATGSSAKASPAEVQMAARKKAFANRSGPTAAEQAYDAPIPPEETPDVVAEAVPAPAMPTANGVITTPAMEGPASIATGIPTIAPGTDNQPGVPNVQNPVASAIPEGMQLDAEAQALMSQLSPDLSAQMGIDPSLPAAVNKQPAPAKKQASPEQLDTQLTDATAQIRTSMGEPGSPERAAAVDRFMGGIANAETGTHRNPWVRTGWPPPEGSTAYGPLQMTDGLLKEMQTGKNKAMFTPAETKMISLLREQAAKFNKFGTNPAYMKENPGSPDPRQLPDYDPRYDYSVKGETDVDIPSKGGGEDWTPEQKELYMSIGGKMLDKLLDKYDGDVSKVTTAWRYGANSGKSALAGDPKYVEKVLAGLNNG